MDKIETADEGAYAPSRDTQATEITDAGIAALKSKRFDVCRINYANPDMVGHTGDLQATIAAVEHCDAELGRLLAAVEELGGVFLVTSDHGNADDMVQVTNYACPASSAHVRGPHVLTLAFVARSVRRRRARRSSMRPASRCRSPPTHSRRCLWRSAGQANNCFPPCLTLRLPPFGRDDLTLAPSPLQACRRACHSAARRRLDLPTSRPR